jgi:SAM-dependent methyltransferase
MNLVSQLRQRIREKGVIGTARILLAHFQDLAFDFKYGTDTLRWHELEGLEVVGANKVHGVYYQPTQARTLWKVLRDSGLPPEGAFLDLGCGKGRTLILAAEYGYKQVVGVEFSALLCGIAETNLARYAQHSARGAAFQVVHADAAEYPIPDDVSVLFMFNPFDAVIMAKVMQNIAMSLQRRLRDLHVIYRHPLHAEVLDASGLFREAVRHRFPQCDFLVYGTRTRRS